MHLPLDATDDQILEFVDSWADDLAGHDYSRAYARTGHDPYYEWSPDLIEKVVAGYGLPNAHTSADSFAVTSRSQARGEQSSREVVREDLPPGTLAEVLYDLPLNGEWSDLTATFRLVKVDDGLLVILQEIHVF